MSLFNSKLDRKSSTPPLFSNSMDSTIQWYAPGVIARQHALDANLPDILRPTALEVLRKLGKRRTPDKRSLGLNRPKKAMKKGLIFIQISQWRLKSPSPQKSPPPQIRPQQGYSPSPMHPKTNLRQAQLRPNLPRLRADPPHHPTLSIPHLPLLATHPHGSSVICRLVLVFKPVQPVALSALSPLCLRRKSCKPPTRILAGHAGIRDVDSVAMRDTCEIHALDFW